MVTVECPFCIKDIPVPKDKTRTEALTKHLQEVHKGGG